MYRLATVNSITVSQTDRQYDANRRPSWLKKVKIGNNFKHTQSPLPLLIGLISRFACGEAGLARSGRRLISIVPAFLTGQRI